MLCGANSFLCPILFVHSRLHVEVIPRENPPSLAGVFYSKIKKNGLSTALYRRN